LKALIHVVAAVIHNQADQILIAQRAADKHQGSKWEFPGGKVEQGETALSALQRELHEELGIQIDTTQAQPLIKIQHHYPDQSIILQIWTINDFSGKAYGREGQPVKWVDVNQLDDYRFPEANIPIIMAARLPDVCLITPEPRHEPNFLDKLETALKSGIRLVQFRAKESSNADYMDLARHSIALVHHYNGKILLNSPPLWLKDADGMHLSSSILNNTPFRPSMQPNKLLTVACHNQDELDKALYIQADAVFISAVKATASHPMANPITWQGFQQLTDQLNLPAYALGGLGLEDIDTAKSYGGQGIAAISAVWPK
jgi:8-oxo-dGTP diphosphatase